jgi:hypothetical protein
MDEYLIKGCQDERGRLRSGCDESSIAPLGQPLTLNIKKAEKPEKK